jgi:hypothetical protein
MAWKWESYVLNLFYYNDVRIAMFWRQTVLEELQEWGNRKVWITKTFPEVIFLKSSDDWIKNKKGEG